MIYRDSCPAIEHGAYAPSEAPVRLYGGGEGVTA